MEDVPIALLCACSTHPGGAVLQGRADREEEEMYNRTYLAQHLKCFIDREWPYPLEVSNENEAKALLVRNVLCHRHGCHQAYGVMKRPFQVDVILAAPCLSFPDYGELNRDNTLIVCCVQHSKRQ